MKKVILGRKIGMTQLFNEDGLSIPVTVIEAGPCTVVQKKTVESDGYNALRVGFVNVVDKRLNKPDKGLFSKAKVTGKRFVRELGLEDINGFEVGQDITVADMFQNGEKVDVSGISKGKGFQGTIKRYGQKGGPESHGSMYHRRPGSMGSNTSPARVFKGKKLPGHMGSDKITVQNLDIIRVDTERNLLLVKGAVPGPKGNLLVIKNTVKGSK